MSESSRPPWLFPPASLRRRILVAVALALALCAVALVVMAVARVVPVISGPGDAAPVSIPTGTPLPTQAPPTEPSLPAPTPQQRTPLTTPIPPGGQVTEGEPDATQDVPGGAPAEGDVPADVPGGVPGGDATDGEVAEGNNPGGRPTEGDVPGGEVTEGEAGSPGSSAPDIIPPDTPPVTIGQTGPAILSFAASSPVAMCENEFTATVELEFRWNTQGATAGWFAPGTVNALLHESSPVDLEARGVSGVVFDCRKNQEIYALTVSDGLESVSATSFVVRRLIWPDD